MRTKRNKKCDDCYSDIPAGEGIEKGIVGEKAWELWCGSCFDKMGKF